MNTREQTWNGRIFYAWIIMMAVACLVYAMGIAHESFWFDEAYSAVMAEHPLTQLLTFIGDDNHPPLYYLLLRMVRVALGNAEWALRSLSVLGAVALVGLGAGPVRRIFGNTTAFIYAGVTLCTPVILIYAHEARMYALATCAVTAGVLYGYLAARQNRPGDWVKFGLATLAAAYLHYYGLIAAFYTHLFVGCWLLFTRRRHLKAYLCTGAAVLAGYLPWLVVFVKQVRDVHKGFWIDPVSLKAVLRALYQPFAYKEFFPDIQPAMSLALLVSLALLGYGVVWATRKQAEPARTFSLLVLVVYLSVLITAILVSLVLTPVFYPRYMITCTGLVVLLLSLGISSLPGKFWRPAAVSLFALLNIMTLKDVYTRHFNHPMKQAAQHLKSAIQPGDLIITSDSYSMGPALYYFPDAVHYHSNNNIEAQWAHVLKPFIPPLHYEEGLKDLLATHQSFWYITCNSGLSKNISAILKDEQGWEASLEPTTYAEPFSRVAFTVQQYRYTGREAARPQGALHIHITGLRPVGYLAVALYNTGPLYKTAPPYRLEGFNATEEEVVYTVNGLEYGEYALILAHDENKNHALDFDSNGRLPIEGACILNYDLSSDLANITFDKVKFAFHEPEQTVEAKMQYPPFTKQSNR